MFLLPVILVLNATSDPFLAAEPAYARVPAPSHALAPPAVRTLADDEFDMSYTFVELTYFSTDVDVIDESTDGYGARASLGLFDFLYGFIGYSNEELDFGSESADTDSFELGIGAHLDVRRGLDLIGEVSWIYDDLSSDTDLDDSDSGYTLFAGARWMALARSRGGLEINGGFRWIDRASALLSDSLDGDGTVGAWELGGRYHFLNHLSIGAGYQFLGDDGRWNANARFSF